MGDRTSVMLTVLTAQVEAVKAVGEGWTEIYECSDPDFTEFIYYEVNYGNLEFLDALIAAGIAFDQHWDAGSNYGAGDKSCRFTPEGAVEVKEVYESGQNPDLDALMLHLDDPAKLRELILEHHADVTPRGWENQAEYGKLYRAKQLISQ